MKDFVFYTPTNVIFGKDTHTKVGEVVKSYGFTKVLLHYGKGSVKKFGIYDAVVQSLNAAGVSFVELGGVEPNPKLSLVREGVKLCRDNGVQLVLAVGGGSAIDSAKSIAAGAVADCDPWLFNSRQAEPAAALPVGVVLTLSASGSEMSQSCVITNDEIGLKRGYNSPYNRPLFAICNPELTYTVDAYQTACGVVDIMMHTLERYFGDYPPTELTDNIAEGLLKAVINAGRAAMQNPRDYDARATLMWAGSLSHNELTGAGRNFFFVCHQLEHEISGFYDNVAHAAGLSVAFPAWAKYVYRYNTLRFAQYAKNVWGISGDNDEQLALEGISRTEQFFRELHMPTTMRELGIPESAFEPMAESCTNQGKRKLPSYIELDKAEIVDIFKLAN